MKTDLVTLLLIDSHDGIRHVLARRLNSLPGLGVVGETASPSHGMDLATELRPDVVLFDCNAPGPYAAQLVGRIKQAVPDSLVVVFTSFLTPGEEQLYAEAGVDRCLLKGMPVGELAAELLYQAAVKRKAAGNGHI